MKGETFKKRKDNMLATKQFMDKKFIKLQIIVVNMQS
jgi:hypothetical protein